MVSSTKARNALVYDKDVRLLPEFLREATQHSVYQKGTHIARRVSCGSVYHDDSSELQATDLNLSTITPLARAHLGRGRQRSSDSLDTRDLTEGKCITVSLCVV